MTKAIGSFNTSKELTSCRVVSLSNIDGLYNNGPSLNGVGATLTLTTTTLTIDNVNVNLFDRILLGGQTNDNENGIYYVSHMDLLSLVVLKRSDDYQSSSQVKNGQFLTIDEGNSNKGSMFISIIPSDSFRLGLDSIIFNEVNAIGGPFLTVAGDLSDVASVPDSRTNLVVPAQNQFAGDPNGSVAGVLGDFTIDTGTGNLYMCTVAGDAASAVWTLQGGGSSGPFETGAGTPSAQGTGANGTATGNYSFAYGNVGGGNGVVGAGVNSFAFGDDALGIVTATGNYSLAFGQATQAIGNNSFAFGNTSEGNNDYSLAFGNRAFANANYAVAIGNGVNTNGIAGVAFGFVTGGFVTAAADFSFAFGHSTANNVVAGGIHSFAFGTDTTALHTASGISSFAFGDSCNVGGNYSLGFGTGAGTFADYSFAFGNGAGAGNLGSFAFGDQSATLGNYSFAFGAGSTNTHNIHAFAFGNACGVTGNYGFAFGLSATASSAHAFSHGEHTVASGSSSFAFGLANGTSVTASGDYSFAFGDGTTTAITAAGNNSFAFGASGTKALGNFGFAFGLTAVSTNAGSWVINDGTLIAPADSAAGQFVTGFTNGYHLYGGSLNVVTAGSGLAVAEGSDCKQGVVTLSGGVGVVSNTSVTANSRIFYCGQDTNVTGFLTITARSAGSGFTITSSVGTDTGVVAYQIFEPAV